MKRRTMLLAALAVFVVIFGRISPALAYFTTYVEARGGLTVELGSETSLTERLSRWTKHVSVKSADGSQSTFVRLRAFCGSAFKVAYEGEGWALAEDGWCYWDEVLHGGGDTDGLDIRIDGAPEEPETGESFNVVIVYETTPVVYDEDGNARADWDAELIERTVEGGGA